MNAEQYIHVLDSCLLPQANQWFEGSCRFQHNNAPCHTAKRVQSFMVDRGVNVLPWPSNSPDMNPIETLWAVIKARLRQHTLTRKNDLINKFLDI